MRKTIAIALILTVLLTGCAAPTTDTNRPTQSQQRENVGYALGNTMPAIAVTTVDEDTLSLYDLLEEKKLVVLNFWFADCIWCVREFPVMELAYQRYQSDVEILALNPSDPTSVIEDFRQEHSLSFSVAVCTRDTVMSFGVSGYPTSVFIDRYGKICLIHSGAITDPSVFYEVFDYFTADDYESRSFQSISQLPV